MDDAVTRYCAASEANDLRPWLATTVFALLLGPKVARHPGVLWRALRSHA